MDKMTIETTFFRSKPVHFQKEVTANPFFRTISVHFYVFFSYLCTGKSVNTSTYMAGTVKEMSLIKQVLQLKFYDHLKQNLVAQKDVTTVLAQTYKPGEKLMIDFAGVKLSYIDTETGEIIKVEVFVACMPYSDYIYVICVPSQRTEDFLFALRMCLEHLGGVPPIVVPDNLKAAVIPPDRHEPEHMTSNSRAIMERSAAYYVSWAGKKSEECKADISEIFNPQRTNKPEEVYYRLCGAIFSSYKKYESSLVNLTCRQCLDNRVFTYKKFEAILKHNYITQSDDEPCLFAPVPTDHVNMRGSDYFK